MSLRQVVLATNLAIAHVNGLQLDRGLNELSDPPAIKDVNDKSIPATSWDLCKQNVSVPNFGGKGEDQSLPEVMRLSEITQIGDQKLDMVVSVTDDSKPTFEANTPDNNRVESCFGYTNVASGSSVKLNFRFTKPGESAAWDPGNHVPYFKFTVMDLDESTKVEEEVIFHTPFENLYLADPHDFHYHPDVEPITFRSNSTGNGSDNPTNPMKLTPLQQTRSFSVGFRGKTEWNVSFHAISEKKRGGRNFMWAGTSNVPDARACDEWKDATFAWGLCDSELTTNNLGGYGPDVGDDIPEEIRYSKVGHFHHKDMDLVVKADRGYVAYNVSRNTVVDTATRKYASLHGCYGAINVKADSRVSLTFSFVDHYTGEPMKFGEDDGFGFTVYDIDRDSKTNAEEAVKFITGYAHGLKGHVAGKNVEQDGPTFRAASTGNGKDNIYDKTEEDTAEQKDKSVRVMYQGTSGWIVEFQVHGGTEGRNFLFSGCANNMEDVPQPHI